MNTPTAGIVLQEGAGDLGAKKIANLIQVPTIPGGQIDLKEQIEAMSQRAQRRQERNGGGLGLDILDEAGLIELTAGGLENQTDRLIREAEALIAERRYPAALRKLDEALAGSPDHTVALLLKGESLSHQGAAALQAIETVRPLRAVELKPRLKRRLDRLLSKLREALVPEMLQDFVASLQQGGPATAAGRMERYKTAEPSIEDIYFLSGAGWMMSGDLDKARAEVKQGQRACAGQDCPRLEMLRRQVALQLALHEMEEAVREVKRGAHKKAMARLRKWQEAAGDLDLYGDLCRFVKAVGKAGGFKGRNFVPAKVGAERRNNLTGFVIAQELGEAQALIERGAFAQAEQALARALKYMPKSHVAHFMIAFSIFVGMIKTSNASRGLDPDHVEDRLRDLPFCTRLLALQLTV